MEKIYSAFQYKGALALDGFPYTGNYSTYSGGGYVYQMRGSLGQLVGNVSMLQKLNWVNRQTRAVFIEFTLYNANIDLFSYCTILFEFLPSGNILKSFRFQPLNLLGDITAQMINTIFFVIYLAMIIFSMVREIKLAIKLKWAYLREIWSWNEWTIISLSFASFAMFIYRINKAYDVQSFVKKYGGYGYIKLQYASFWNDELSICLGLVCFLATLKFFKLLRFYPRISLLFDTLRGASRDLVSFSVVFLVVWIAFVQLFYILLNNKLSQFQSLLTSMETCFQICLGKFQATLNETLPIMVYVFYHLVIIFTMLNLFIAIIVDAFDDARNDPVGSFSENFIMQFIKAKILNIFVKSKSQKATMGEAKYKDTSKNVQRLAARTDSLMGVVTNVCGLFFLYY
jgi:polycystin 1L2